MTVPSSAPTDARPRLRFRRRARPHARRSALVPGRSPPRAAVRDRRCERPHRRHRPHVQIDGSPRARACRLEPRGTRRRPPRARPDHQPSSSLCRRVAVAASRSSRARKTQASTKRRSTSRSTISATWKNSSIRKATPRKSASLDICTTRGLTVREMNELHARYDEAWRADLAHVAADMNGSPVFLVAALKMKLKMAERRALAREDGRPAPTGGPLTRRRSSPRSPPSSITCSPRLRIRRRAPYARRTPSRPVATPKPMLACCTTFSSADGEAILAAKHA